MSTYTCNINGAQFGAICNYWENRHAWGHEVQLYEDGCLVASKKIRYYNRTWEAYTYQYTILGAIKNLLSSAEAEYLAKFKREHGYKRITAARREDLKKYLAYCDELQKYAQLYEHFRSLR